MRKLIPAAILAVSMLPGTLGAQSAKALPLKYKTWLDEEVVYIITKHERDVFLQLKTDRERDIFIDAFWKQRDPSPDTPRNEFREEHEKRFAYATKMYGRGTPLPGWKTDRGRMYIILGPPRNIEQYDNVNGVYPVEIWFYLGDPDLGLPTGFNLIFFKRNGLGDYVLYSPTEDGPRSLIAESMNNYQNDQAAYKALKQLEPNLAPQTLSLIPGEQTIPGMESLASNKLIADIGAAPMKKVSVDYADAILKFKDFVEVDYSANYVASEAALQVVEDAAGGYLVHYSIEPSRIAVEKAEENYRARFQLTGRVSDEQGRTIFQFDKDFPFSLTPAELEDARAKSIAIQDAFPLVPGSYRFDILLKNTLSREFTGAEMKVVVPAAGAAPQISPLLLAYGDEKKSSPAGERVPFKVGGDQILCQARKTFAAKDTLVVFFQLFGMTPEMKASGKVRISYLQDDKEVAGKDVVLAGSGGGTSFFDSWPLADIPPGYYQVKVSWLDGQGREVASRKEIFEVSPAASVPRPMVISKVTASVRREDDLYATGIQYMNKGDLAEARTRLADAYHLAPGRVEFAVAYGGLLFNVKEYKAAKDVLAPFAGAEGASGDVLSLLGRACHALGEYRDALTHYTNYLNRFGMNIDILNYVGTCWFQLGNKDEAVKAWTKSLELAPNQERIRQLLESLKK